MHSLKQSLLLLSSLYLLLRSVAADGPFITLCSQSSSNYTASDPFSENLNQLMFQLITGAPCSGFGLSSVGQGIDKVNGLALCRGDMNSTACKTCIRTANARIRQDCPSKKDAAIWFDGCFLRYSDDVFFGEIDHQEQFVVSNTQNVSSTTPSQFSAQVMQLMDSLKDQVHPPLLFASEAMEVGMPEKLYGLVQCNRDLSGEDCNKCLETLIALLPDGKRGAKAVNRNCNVRYELYPFFNA